MRTILFIIQKEFLQVFRNKTMLPFIFVVPIVQLVVLVYAATMEMKNIKMVIVDQDHSQASTELARKFHGSPFYTIVERSASVDNANEFLKKGESDIILVIPASFERELIRENSASVQLRIDAINGMTAGLIQYYTQSILFDFNRNIISDFLGYSDMRILKNINIEYSYWYNENLNYKIFMLPGILVILVTIMGMFLSALNLVREKEMGTIEQINVTPIRKYQFIIGKLIPFWIIAMFELAFGVVFARLIFNMPLEGSLGLLFFFTSVYLLAPMGIGLLVSAISDSQQQVMFIVFFFMLTFVLMSGIFTPVESMPKWAIQVNVINPFAYYMRAIRMIILKGSGIMDVMHELISLSIYGIVMLSLAIWRYRKTV